MDTEREGKKRGRGGMTRKNVDLGENQKPQINPL